MAHITYFWILWVGHNQLVNTKVSKLSKEIADPNDNSSYPYFFQIFICVIMGIVVQSEAAAFNTYSLPQLLDDYEFSYKVRLWIRESMKKL